MLYAWRGIDYWATVGPREDPYAIAVPGLPFDAATQRKFAKGLMLIALNAESDTSALKAFHQSARDDGNEAAQKLSAEQARAILVALREKHRPIADDFGSGKGIDLMNQDARITEGIIKRFLSMNRPILSIHDSYIVTFGDGGLLRDAMRKSFEEVTGVGGVQLKRVGHGYDEVMGLPEGDQKQAMTGELLGAIQGSRSEGYLRRQERFHSW
jgi:hypothetical protein